MLLRKLSLLAAIATLTLATVPATAQDDDVQHVRFAEDVLALEYVGNVNNTSEPTPTSLATSTS